MHPQFPTWLLTYALYRTAVAAVFPERGRAAYPVRSYVVALSHQGFVLPLLHAAGDTRGVYASTFAYLATDIADTCAPPSLLFWHHVVSCAVITGAQSIQDPRAYRAGATVALLLEGGALGLHAAAVWPCWQTKAFRVAWFAASRVATAQLVRRVLPRVASPGLRLAVGACLLVLLAQNARQVWYYVRSLGRSLGLGPGPSGPSAVAPTRFRVGGKGGRKNGRAHREDKKNGSWLGSEIGATGAEVEAVKRKTIGTKTIGTRRSEHDDEHTRRHPRRAP